VSPLDDLLILVVAAGVVAIALLALKLAPK
jgi:hypothetical protein